MRTLSLYFGAFILSCFSFFCDLCLCRKNLGDGECVAGENINDGTAMERELNPTFPSSVCATLEEYREICTLPELPVIYALMITGKDQYHFSFARQALADFRAQTYPFKKLIIINDGNYSLVGENSAHAKDVIEVRVKKQPTLGHLRNLALEQVPINSIWVQWDDDDWHHPVLMESQWAFLYSKCADAVVLRNQIYHNLITGNSAIHSTAKSGRYAWLAHEGTVMTFRHKGLYYPHQRTGEDTEFLLRFLSFGYSVTVWDNDERMYMKLIHNHNAFGEVHHEGIMNAAKPLGGFSSQNKKAVNFVLSSYYSGISRHRSGPTMNKTL